MALAGVVMGLQRLQSGLHDIQFIIGADHDDANTGAVIQELKNEAHVASAWDARSTLGAVWNRLVAADKTADIVTLCSDRTFCITPGWDDVLADAVEKRSDRVLWWSSPGDNDHTLPILSKRWLEAADYTWGSDIFPFWFSDTWGRELDRMIHGKPPLKVQAQFAGTRAATQSGRDFAFWFDVFSKLRPYRISQAVEMAEKLKSPFFDPLSLMPLFKLWDAEMQERSPDFEKQFGDKRPPSATYIAAKEKAEALLKELNL